MSSAVRTRRVTLPPPGTVLADRYQLLHPIGEGGMSTVYLAEHIAIGRKFAIKILVPEFRDNPDVVNRFVQEARAVSRIRHEHIVDITDIGKTSEGLAFLAMEYLEGEDLYTMLLREGRLSWMRLRRMVLQICRALHAAHRKGVVHRDIKPENVFRIKRGGNHDFIKLLDFGIAKVVADGSGRFGKQLKTETGDRLMLGTPEYMAPELTRGEAAGELVDVYSLGALMYHALVGNPPFSAPTAAEVIAMQLRDDPVPPRQAAPDAEIPMSIERIVMRALAKTPADRFASIRELTEAIIRADARLSRVTQTQIALDRRAPADTSDERTASGAIELEDRDLVEVLDPDEIFDLRTRAHADEDTVIFFNPALAAKAEAKAKAKPTPQPTLDPRIQQLRRIVIGLGCTCILLFFLGLWIGAATTQPEQTPAEQIANIPSPATQSPQPEEHPAKGPEPLPGALPVSDADESAAEVKPTADEDDDEEVADSEPPPLESLSRREKKALVKSLQQPVLNCARFDHLKRGTRLNIKFQVHAKSGNISATVPPVYKGRLFDNCVKKAASQAQSKRGMRSAIVWGRYKVPS